jgi:hypothetical protein
MIAVDVAQRPILARNVAFTEVDLILDRGVALELGRLLGVNRSIASPLVRERFERMPRSQVEDRILAAPRRLDPHGLMVVFGHRRRLAVLQHGHAHHYVRGVARGDSCDPAIPDLCTLTATSPQGQLAQAHVDHILGHVAAFGGDPKRVALTATQEGRADLADVAREQRC